MSQFSAGPSHAHGHRSTASTEITYVGSESEADDGMQILIRKKSCDFNEEDLGDIVLQVEDLRENWMSKRLQEYLGLVLNEEEASMGVPSRFRGRLITSLGTTSAYWRPTIVAYTDATETEFHVAKEDDFEVIFGKNFPRIPSEIVFEEVASAELFTGLEVVGRWISKSLMGELNLEFESRPTKGDTIRTRFNRRGITSEGTATIDYALKGGPWTSGIFQVADEEDFVVLIDPSLLDNMARPVQNALEDSWLPPLSLREPPRIQRRGFPNFLAEEGRGDNSEKYAKPTHSQM
jgi:hypothetical protein